MQMHIIPFMYFYYWRENDNLTSKHVTKLKTQHLLVVLTAAYTYLLLKYGQPVGRSVPVF